MCIPWKKMKKDERHACAYHKMIKGFAVLLFGLIWMYFASYVFFDVWDALPPTLAAMGLLCFLYGLVMKFSF